MVIYFIINYCPSLAVPNLFITLGQVRVDRRRHSTWWAVQCDFRHLLWVFRSISLDEERLWCLHFNLKKIHISMFRRVNCVAGNKSHITSRAP